MISWQASHERNLPLLFEISLQAQDASETKVNVVFNRRKEI